jgi:hypothetical protein
MKTIFIIAINFFAIHICNAQTIYDITDNRPDLGTYNFYMKDTNNLLDPFVGTWVYSNGSESITMVLKKKIKFKYSSVSVFEDLLYGGYRYVQNGVEIINTIPQIDDPNITNFFSYSIEGNGFPQHSIFNNDPNVSGYVLDLSMKEPNGVLSTLQMYVTTVNGVTALRVFKDTFTEGVGHLKGTPHYETVMPQGYLTFIKQ